MKPRALLLVVPVSLAACSTSETIPPPPPPPVDWASLVERPPPDAGGKATATAKERAIADAYLAALATPGCAGLASALDEDAHFAFAGYRDVRGRDLVVRAHDALLGAFDQRKLVATRVFLTDASQVIEWTLSGVHKESAKPVRFRGVTLLWTKDDGAISDVHLYYDDAAVKAEVGAGPKGLTTLPLPDAPTGERVEYEQAGTPDEQSALGVFTKHLEALESENVTSFLGTMKDDVEITTLESLTPSRGKAAAAAYYKMLHKAIGQLDTAIDNALAAGPFVAVEYHVVGEQKAAIGWVPAQKNTLVKLYVVDVAEIRSGAIARVWRYENPSQILATP